MAGLDVVVAEELVEGEALPLVAPTIAPKPTRRLAPAILCHPQKQDLVTKIRRVLR